MSKVRKLIFLILLIWSPQTYAQQDIPAKSSSDTLLIVSENSDSNELIDKPSLEGSIRKTQEFTIALNSISHALQFKLDTAEILQNIPLFERLINTVSERLQQEEINLRYLSALENLLNSVQSQIRDVEKPINRRVEALSEVREKLDVIRNDDLFKYSLRDTSLLPEYQLAIGLLRERIKTADSILADKRILVASFQSRISSLIIRGTELGEIIDVEQSKLEKALFTKENNYIWEPKNFPTTERLADIFVDSLVLNEVIFTRYLKNHLPVTGFLILATFLLYGWIRSNLRKIKKEKEFAKIILERIKYVNSSPFLSAVIILLPIASFFYFHPPISFVTVILVILVMVTSILLKRHRPWKSYWIWVLMIFVFLVYTISNLYWQTAFQERWHLLVLSIVGLFLAFKLLRLQEKFPKSLPYYLRYLANFYIIFQSASIIANIFGRFSLSKMLGVASTMSFVQAISLYIFVQTIMEVIYIQLEVSKKRGDEYTSYWDFQGIQKRLKRFFAGLALLIWGYYFLDNLSLLDLVLGETKLFLTTPRNFFDGNFTFGSVVVFMGVVYVATVLANNIAYFASIKDQKRVDNRDKRLGSSILLIRLGVLTFGFLIAIGASGIPIDKITIILGALSLGIGFGLQTIVNNLVSGIILAFERPIQIGDDIEVGGRIGKVKDVGIRSSKLAAYDGSEIIIPNGDLLSQHLINWTLSNKQRRVELLIGVSYHSDMEKVAEILKNQVIIEGILKNPEPKVHLQTFADSSVEFRVLFWVDNMDNWLEMRNKVMVGIFKAFKEEGVEIPFPQRDLNFRSLPNELSDKLDSPISKGIPKSKSPRREVVDVNTPINESLETAGYQQGKNSPLPAVGKKISDDSGTNFDRSGSKDQ